MPSSWHGIKHKFDVTELDEDDKKIVFELAQTEMEKCNQEAALASEEEDDDALPDMSKLVLSPAASASNSNNPGFRPLDLDETRLYKYKDRGKRTRRARTSMRPRSYKVRAEQERAEQERGEEESEEEESDEEESDEEDKQAGAKEDKQAGAKGK
ncbi:hypothetical protein T484DRAFT_1755452 [Baffinella frigidus]|nr:hypothetical protein T484DRAFT_1755452 [Cryptophyta sp. CCMP2293]